jgi:hypothetical protein
MKILKIKEIKTWKPDHGKWTMYSTWAILDYQGKEVKGKLACFVPGVIKEGAEISENDYDIKVEQKTYQGETYTQYTLKKKKQNTWNKGYQKTTYTLEEFEALMDRAVNYAKDINEQEGLTRDIVFERYINNAPMYGVKVPGDKSKTNEQIVKEEVAKMDKVTENNTLSQEDKDFFNDTEPDIPFNPEDK